MKIGPMKPNLLSFAVATVLGCSTFSIYAEEADNEKEKEEEKVITVTGIRGSVIKSMDIKRDAQGVVDAITMEDIGKFPDTNLAESLQRTSGVSIDRKNGEGNQITVRGFGPSFNLVTLNGRSMPFADSPKQEGAGGTQNRSFNFEQIASESVSGVNLYKTSRADQASGGIGATVDIQTAKPFNFDGQKTAFSIKASNDTTVVQGDDVTPEVSGMYSNTFNNNKFGFLAAASFSKRDSAQEIIATDGWLRQTAGNCELGFTTSVDACGGNTIDDSAIDSAVNPDGTIWLPQNYNMDVSNHERERKNAQLVFQFEMSDNLVGTFDYFYSNYTDNVERYQTAHWFGNWVNGATDANGTIAQINNGAGGTDFIGYYDEIETQNDSIGFNFVWSVSDTLTATFDIHSSTSHAQPDGNLSEQSILLTSADFNCATPQQCFAGQFTVDYGLGTDLPVLSDPATMASFGWDGLINHLYGNGANERPFDGMSPYDFGVIGGNLVIGRGNEVESSIDQFKVDFVWDNDSNGALTQIKFGAGHVDFQYDTTWRMNMTTLGRAWNPSADQLSLVSSSGTAADFSGSSSLFPYFVQFDVEAMYNQIRDEFGFTFNPEVYNEVNEATTSAYAQFAFETEFNGTPIDLVAGVRYEQTDVTGVTRQVTPYALRYESLTELRPQFAADAEYGTSELKGDYAYFLPSLDVKIELNEEMILRTSVGRSLTRTDLTALRPAVSIANSRPNGPYLAYQGNADLQPYLADNFDLSFEWYYAEGSYASIGYFKKLVDNYVSTNTVSGVLYNADGVAYTDPSQGDLGACPANGLDDPICDGTVVPNSPVINWQLTSPVNEGSSEIDGFELAIQHIYGETGFGIQANATFVDGDVDYDVFSTDNQVALTGLSDSYNLVAFYDKNGVQARIAYNWRDDFLFATDQLRAPDEPVFTEAYGQWDINASYDLSENLSIFVEGLNITDENIRLHGRFENQLISAQSLGARYNIGIRGSF